MTATDEDLIPDIDRDTNAAAESKPRPNTDVCPACLDRGTKWITTGPMAEVLPDGRPQLVRDLRGVERARAKRLGYQDHQIWPCQLCNGFRQTGRGKGAR